MLQSEYIEKSTVISIRNIGKCYKIYKKPKDRFNELLFLGNRKLHKQYWALQNISFDVKKGDCIGIIGRNGSGKSTLLQIICGTLTPSNGTVQISGRVSALLELGAGFSPNFTGIENVYMNATILGLSKKEIDSKIVDIARFADIGDFINQPVKTYSSGMYVRLAFSVAIHVDPDILIIDEALAVGDISFRAKCYEKLDELRQKQTTILFVSHEMKIIKALCNHVVYLKEGRVEAIGDPGEIVEQYWLDIRSLERDGKKSPQIIRKPSLGGDGSMAFGTNEGSILKAEFAPNGMTRRTFRSGDTITTKIDVEYGSSIKNPALSIIINNRKSIEIGGTYILLANRNHHSRSVRSTIISNFKASLSEGTYFITCRLEDRTSDDQFFPIDKQVAALSFDIISHEGKNIVGFVDFQIDSKEIEVKD